MKRLLLLAIAVIFSATGAFAQLTHTAKGAVDETAKAILKKASAKMSGTVSFSVTVVNYDSNKKETFRQKVDILYNAPRYRVKAGSMEIYCDGKAVWQYNQPNKEVVVSPMTDSDDDITNPARLLANYDKSFRAKYIREESDGTAEQHNFDSSRGEYTLSNFKNTKAADSDFTFNTKAHPGVEVVDMR